jgi:hypothetical protein
MATMRLGGTIALPGFSNIKVEVEANGYAQTKEYLRVVLLQMAHEQATTGAIINWWRATFGTFIYDDVMQE